MNSNFCILISSCNKFSDLWDQHILMLRQFWQGDLPEIYLITDENSDRHYEGVTILAYNDSMPVRIKKACEHINHPYVLLTLDDYFLIEYTGREKIEYLVNSAAGEKIDYLRIYDRRYDKQKYFTDISVFTEINLNEKYAVSLYPAIWNKEFLIKCVDEDSSPWEFEPQLTDKAKELSARCFFNRAGCFQILDVVRKGKILHKASRYFKRHGIDIGDRPLISWKVEIRQWVADMIWWHMPRWVYRLARRTGEFLGMKFYSAR